MWEYGLFANFKPGHQETWVDYDADRAPLLFIGGEKDHIMPPSVNKSNAKHYKKSPALTEYYEFEGRDHWTCAAPGWEAVADHALDWALEHAPGAAGVGGRRLTPRAGYASSECGILQSGGLTVRPRGRWSSKPHPGTAKLGRPVLVAATSDCVRDRSR